MNAAAASASQVFEPSIIEPLNIDNVEEEKKEEEKDVLMVGGWRMPEDHETPGFQNFDLQGGAERRPTWTLRDTITEAQPQD